MPSPPAFGVWLSVPIIIPPGNAYCSSTTWWMMPGARLPEADPVLRRHALQEVVDLGVRVDGDAEVDLRADLRLDQVVTVHGRRDSHGRQARGHELQQRHLRGRVLHGHAVGIEVGVAAPPFEPGGLCISQMVDEDLLGQGERVIEALAGRRPPVRPTGSTPARRVRSACRQSWPWVTSRVRSSCANDLRWRVG